MDSDLGNFFGGIVPFLGLGGGSFRIDIEFEFLELELTSESGFIIIQSESIIYILTD